MTNQHHHEPPRFASHSTRERYRSMRQGLVPYFAESVLEFAQVFVNGPLFDAKQAFHRCVRRWLAHWELKLLEELRPEDLAAYYTRLLHKDFPATDLQEDGHFLKQLFDWTVRASYLDKSPIEDVPTLRRRRRRRAVAWNLAEQKRLLAACRSDSRRAEDAKKAKLIESPTQELSLEERGETTKLCPPLPSDLEELAKWRVPDYLFPIVLLGLRTGLRLGDLLYLTWDRVRLETCWIRIPGNDSRYGHDVDVGLDDQCVSELRRIHGVFAELPSRPERVFQSLDLPLHNGFPDYRRVQLDVRAAALEAGIRPGEFNSLRSAFAYNCARDGISLAEAELLVDWDDLQGLARIYDKHYPSFARLIDTRPGPESA